MSAALILDTTVLAELTAAIGADALHSIIEIFLQECRELAATINGAASPEIAGRAAHSLKSSAGQLGASALAEAALAVETAAKSDAAALPALISRLLDCAARSQSALAERLAG